MTVVIYVDASKQVGNRDHLKVFANANAAETWFAETTSIMSATGASFLRPT
jgi:hypothetical protein